MANTVSRILSDDTLNRIVQIESAGKPTARAGTSSAAGLGQFIVGTWRATVHKHKPALFNGKTNIEVDALRVGNETAALQLEMLARFTEDNARALGSGYTDGDLYLAHFLGLGDAGKLFRASPDTPAASVVSASAVTANRSILAGKTCAQVRAWALESMRSRWERAGRPDWVKRYAGGVVVLPPPKPTPAADAGKVTGGIAAGGGVVAGAGAAVDAGWSAMEITMLVVGLLVAVAAGYFAWRWWRARKAPVEMPIADSAVAADEPAAIAPSDAPNANADAIAAEIANKARGSVAIQVAAAEMAKPARRKRKATPAKRKAAKKRANKRRAK